MLTEAVFFQLAYIDPSAGMLALQVFLAGVVGTMTVYRHKVLGFFRRKRMDGDAVPPPAHTSSPKARDGKGN